MNETKKQQQAAGRAKEPAARQKEAMVYIGPDIPGAKQYTTYNNGLPDALKERIREHPFFNSLIIPAGKLAKANAELAKEGSALNSIYRKAGGKY